MFIKTIKENENIIINFYTILIYCFLIMKITTVIGELILLLLKNCHIIINFNYININENINLHKYTIIFISPYDNKLIKYTKTI